jgi:hypothetical protein
MSTCGMEGGMCVEGAVAVWLDHLPCCSSQETVLETGAPILNPLCNSSGVLESLQ